MSMHTHCPLQIILAVAIHRRRPPIPSHCPPGLHALIAACWRDDPRQRPPAYSLVARLEELLQRDMERCAVQAAAAAAAQQRAAASGDWAGSSSSRSGGRGRGVIRRTQPQGTGQGAAAAGSAAGVGG